jgi:ribosomal protein L37AE/L43A
VKPTCTKCGNPDHVVKLLGTWMCSRHNRTGKGLTIREAFPNRAARRQFDRFARAAR